jgi:hypothetical protein
MSHAEALDHRAVLGYTMLAFADSIPSGPLPGQEDLNQWEPILYIIVIATVGIVKMATGLPSAERSGKKKA